MTKEEKFKALVSNEKTDTLAKNRERIKNRKRLRESQAIAMKVLDKLDEPGWSQVRLAKEMGVSPQQITKIVSGKENLTLDTQIRLQEILNIPILATFYEKQEKNLFVQITFLNEQIFHSEEIRSSPMIYPVRQLGINSAVSQKVFSRPQERVYQKYEKQEKWHLQL
jgi:transcriptional regulator with XRE-family HTH domain